MKSMSGFGGGVASLIMKTAAGDDGLVFHFDASDSSSYSGSGSTSWNDLSGNGNHATLIGPPSYSTGNGGYLDFDGTNDYGTLPTLDIAGNEITFSVWMFGIQTTYGSVLFLGDTGDNSGGRILSIHLPYIGTTVYFDKGTTPGDGSSGPGTQYDRINKNPTSSEYKGWHQWVFTANAATGSMKIYLDGSLWHSGTGKTKTFANVSGDRRYIMSNYAGDKHRAYVSNMLLYKKELSASEILQNYNSTKSKFDIITTNLVLHLDAGNSSSYSGSGTTWTDLTGNGNNGTLVNGVSYSSSDGGYLSFDGSNDRVDFSTYVQPAYTSSTSFTWLIWVYPTSYSNNDVIMGNRVISGTNVWTKLTPTRFEWKYPNHLDNSTDVTQNQWQNICIVKNGSSFTYYKNGSSIDTMTSNHSKNHTNPFYLGGDPSYGENPACRISIVAVYDAALTASEVLHNYNATKGRYGL